MIEFAIGLETKTRPEGKSYLQQTLGNLERAGIYPSPHFHSLTVTYGDGKTRQRNGRDAIADALQAIEPVRHLHEDYWVMKLEDDIDVTDDFLGNVARWLKVHARPRYPMYTFGAGFDRVSKCMLTDGATNIFEERTNFPLVRDHVARGLHAVSANINAFWGAQCVVWHADVAAKLVEWLGEDPVFVDPNGAEHRHRGHDLLLQQFVRFMGEDRYLAAVPSFVQHLGEQSNLDQPEINHKQPFFQFPFAGRGYRYGV